MSIEKIIYFIIISTFSLACQNDYTPKPEAFFRIALDKHEYQTYNNAKRYEFSYSKHSELKIIKTNNEEEEWLNINYPSHNATIHISYKPVDNNLEELLEDSRTFVYKHTVKADAIEEQIFHNKEKSIYGLIYYLKGNTASTTQFIATDSSKHFIRGALYFNVHPNKDSLNPIVNYIDKDIKHLMETLRWK